MKGFILFFDDENPNMLCLALKNAECVSINFGSQLEELGTYFSYQPKPVIIKIEPFDKKNKPNFIVHSLSRKRINLSTSEDDVPNFKFVESKKKYLNREKEFIKKEVIR